MISMRLLDLYCCAGGASRGYHQAGFTDIVGVDNEPQKRYPFTFVQADALAYLEKWGHEFDFVHASPPCQAYTQLRAVCGNREYPDLVAETRDMLRFVGVPYVIENVPGAPLDTTVMLCGTMFGLHTGDAQLAMFGLREGYAELRRHRLFESSLMLMSPGACRHGKSVIGVYGCTARNPQLYMQKYPYRTISVHGTHPRDPGAERRKYRPKVITVTGHTPNVVYNKIRETSSVAQAREAMGIEWMTMAELSQAIPPAYTRWIGEQVLRNLCAKGGVPHE